MIPALKALFLVMIPAAMAHGPNLTEIGSRTEFRQCTTDPRPIFEKTCIPVSSTGATNFSIPVGCREYGNSDCNGNYTAVGYRPGCYENTRFLEPFDHASEGGLYCFAT
ncbi:hypothetical protein BO71DRAFT_465284 [Aspergillus ellipticus CBS 707.79]|uniref:Uncharacterized protein n=1 Tax=Aspergillus ellipticus CBS 707.79 TaxID=1448320 RepID=A0A319EE93_9EURO|nr:hypothetical protein BO71DRAFT_465284 [Aspergillus ellipticus CBS 707.79]